MKFQYEVGMIVCDRREIDYKGIVTKIEDGDVEVRWSQCQYDDEDGEWADTSEMMPDTPEAHQYMTDKTKKVQAKIDEAAVSLEATFKAWRLANALELGCDEDDGTYYEGAYGLTGNPNLDLSKFEKLIEQNGWSKSSLYC